MALFHDSAIAGASGNQGGGVGYQISRSLRFNSSDSAYLSRTPASAGNRKTWTWAGWVKRSQLGVRQTVFDGGGATSGLVFEFSAADKLELYTWGGISPGVDVLSTPVFRDTAAWFHLLVAFDTTQAVPSTYKLYVNGLQINSFDLTGYPAQNIDYPVNSAAIHSIGRRSSSQFYFSGYLADIYFIDGQALTPSSFTEVSATTGQLIPKQYTGSFGTNGFWLKFSDNSAATATTLGKDYSGNSNNWTPNNFNVLSSYTDTFLSRKPDGTSWTNPTYAFDGTTANYADGTAGNGTVSTIRFNKPLTGVTLLEYFYDGTSTYGYNSTDVGTGPNLTGGSWVTVYSGSAITVNNVRCTSQPGNGVVRLYAIRVNGTILNNWTETDPPGCDSTVDTPTSYGTDTGAGGEVRGNYCTWNPLDKYTDVALANGNLDFSQSNAGFAKGTIGVSSGKWYWEVTKTDTANQCTGLCLPSITPTATFTGGTGTGSCGINQVSGTVFALAPFSTANGTTQIGAISNGSVIGCALDADNGTFKIYVNGVLRTANHVVFTPGITVMPSMGTNVLAGVYPTNFGQRPWAFTPPAGFKALCDTNLPAPVVAKPSTVMDVKLYTGNGSTQTISGLGFSPDFVWLKMRSTTGYSHKLVDTVRGATISLVTNNTNAELTEASGLTAFTSDGFSLGSQEPYNRNSDTFVAWAWDAGSSTTTNNSGSISSQVRANPSAGFSIVTYTGTGANATVGHGLNVAPSLVIVKRRNSTSNWLVWNSVIAASNAANVLYLDTTFAAFANSTSFNSTSPTSTVFTVGTHAATNASGGTHVAYCFSPVTGYSSFGSYTGNGSADGPFVYTGFRPRWVMIKHYSGSISDQSNAWWMIVDTVRNAANSVDKRLHAQSSDSEYTNANIMDTVSNGFKIRSAPADAWNFGGGTYIYAAFAENPFQYARAR